MTDRLLVVEDDHDIIALLKVNLAELGLPIDYFSDGALACQAALNNDYILMLLDIMLPNVNGLDICRQVRQAKPEQANVILNIDVAHEVLLVNSDVEKNRTGLN
jgi:two-component system alkaline phosphatase synthesis response regulator PhoP